jgi:hypothetical protein
MTRVERRLPAARLPRRELDLEAGAAQQRFGVGDRLGKDQVAQAGGEELDPPCVSDR